MALYDNKPCNCGSGEIREPQFDGAGNFLTFTCPKCEKKKLSQYNPDVLNKHYIETPDGEIIFPGEEDY